MEFHDSTGPRSTLIRGRRVEGADGRAVPFQVDFPAEEFADRRARVFDRIGEDTVAVIQGAGPVGGFELFRQSNEFYYLCGVEAPQACLLLDGRRRAVRLYLPHIDEGAEKSEGPIASAEDAAVIKKLTGVDAVSGPEALADDLGGATVAYVPHAPAEGRMSSRDGLTGAKRKTEEDAWDAREAREDRFIALLRQRLPGAEIRDLSPILDELRLIKSPREIELCRRAGRLAGLAAMEAMRSTAPGVTEYQLGAVADYVFVSNGAAGQGYRHIIGGGPNAYHGHYSRNDCSLADGDLVLMDGAPDYGYYTSDIGRMWPVSGKYSPVQRELYGFVVEYHQALLRRIRPGMLASAIMGDTAADMLDVVEATDFSKPVYEAAARRMLEFSGHLSHPVGMAVHDVGSYRARPLEPGLVFTVDPQMWVPEERLYIRCEDTVVITEDGIENLTGFAPLTLDDTEALMREDGMLLPFPAEALDD
jgi:Xaa-Pro aminopeptidase